MHTPALAGGPGQLAGDVASDRRPALASPRHAFEHLPRDRHLGHFVLQVLGVAQILKRHQAQQNRNTGRRIDRVEQAFQGIQVIDRRRHQEVRAGRQFAARRGHFVGKVPPGFTRAPMTNVVGRPSGMPL